MHRKTLTVVLAVLAILVVFLLAAGTAYAGQVGHTWDGGPSALGASTASPDSMFWG